MHKTTSSAALTFVAWATTAPAWSAEVAQARAEAPQVPTAQAERPSVAQDGLVPLTDQQMDQVAAGLVVFRPYLSANFGGVYGDQP